MGQAISRRLVTRMEAGLQRARQEMDKQMREEVVRKQQPGRFSDPHAVHDGFQRGQGPTQNPKDMMQKQFLQQKETSTEMPEDLVKFLHDVGPLERKVDTKLTSPRLRERMQQRELEAAGIAEEDSKRQIRDMPIAEDQTDFVVSRTTNFSTVTEEENKERDFGLTDIQMYELLTTSDLEQLWRRTQSNEEVDDVEKEAELEQLRVCRNYLAIPTILKDVDKTYIGAHSDQVRDMQHMKLKLVPESRVKMVLSSLLESEVSR